MSSNLDTSHIRYCYPTQYTGSPLDLASAVLPSSETELLCRHKTNCGHYELFVDPNEVPSVPTEKGTGSQEVEHITYPPCSQSIKQTDDVGVHERGGL